jgi:hypothetical protein
MAPPTIPTMPTTITDFAILVIGIIMLWVATSIPVYIGGKFVRGKAATFGEAISATLLGTLVYLVIFYMTSIILGTNIGFILAFIAWLAIYRNAFDTGWLNALGIVIVSWLILHAIDLLLISILKVAFPNFIPF